jgi:hypothetical protein
LEVEQQAGSILNEAGQRRSVRVQAGIQRPRRYALVSRLREGSHNNNDKNVGIRQTVIDEIDQVFVELEALEPVYECDIQDGIEPLNSHMFMIEKFIVDGKHDKYKSLLVTHGNEQDTMMYPDRSSPMVRIHLIMTYLGLAAHNGIEKVGKIDLKGAFIQTKMMVHQFILGVGKH